MKRLLAILLVTAFVAVGSLAIAAGEKGPAEVKFGAKMGAVTFNHTMHQGKVPDCKTCHHKGVEAGACRACHDGTKGPAFKDTSHKLCKDCHKDKGGPTKCGDCHKK
jgi:predicted CXXCH cytochrome family protein